MLYTVHTILLLTHLLIVDLQVGGSQQVLGLGTDCHVVEYMIESPGDDPSISGWIGHSHHGVALSAAGLTIGKHCAVVAVEYTLHQRETDILVVCVMIFGQGDKLCSF